VFLPRQFPRSGNQRPSVTVEQGITDTEHENGREERDGPPRPSPFCFERGQLLFTALDQQPNDGAHDK